MRSRSHGDMEPSRTVAACRRCSRARRRCRTMCREGSSCRSLALGLDVLDTSLNAALRSENNTSRRSRFNRPISRQDFERRTLPMAEPRCFCRPSSFAIFCICSKVRAEVMRFILALITASATGPPPPGRGQRAEGRVRGSGSYEGCPLPAGADAGRRIRSGNSDRAGAADRGSRRRGLRHVLGARAWVLRLKAFHRASRRSC